VHVEADNVSGGAGGVVADRLARLEARHNTQLLDSALGVDEPLYVQAEFDEHRIPVVLLRRMLLTDTRLAGAAPPPSMPHLPLCGYDRETMLPYVFCSFTRTLAYLRTHDGRALLQQRVLARAAELAAEYDIDVPPALHGPTARAHLIVAAALLRMVVAADMRREIRCNARYAFAHDAHVQYAEFQLQLFSDTHLDLLVGAAVRGACDDDALCAPMSATTALPAEALGSTRPLHAILRRSVFERAYPHALRAVSAGELADMTGAVFDADVWTKASDNTRSKTTELIHNLLSKTLNHRCGGRNFAKMVCEMFGCNAPAYTFIVNILELHALGNYPADVNVRPGVRARLATRRAYSLDELRAEPWCAWCHYTELHVCPHPGCDSRNVHTRPRAHKAHICAQCAQFARIQTKLYAAVREFCVYTVRCHGVVDAMLRADSEWTTYADVVRLAADESRAFTQRMFASPTPLSAAALSALQRAQLHTIEVVQQCNRSVQRLRKDYLYAELMCRMCRHAHTKRLAAQEIPNQHSHNRVHVRVGPDLGWRFMMNQPHVSGKRDDGAGDNQIQQ